ncbi:twin-arginine translocase subunit TatC [Wansuia hejianensis]|uniref:Sec-independent protein translocase protein TatC n=1 Tax=Wansuia hejianensis TaxID=2763667 RepID=A0A926F324_9FIRM|nr:twin-arginine translocase subunit TatC [Wansuia hejianensis]MBC8590994.1 twin-arginine translocase subunit TatC [Wansuia hejianensis]
MEVQDKKQTIVEHLSELRKRLIYGFISLIIFSILSYRFSETIVKDMIDKAPNIEFVFIAPTELFMSYLKIAVIGGIVLSLPIILFNIWLFIKPGLNFDERRLIIKSLFIGGILFLLGALFAYLFVLPMTIVFFTSFQIDTIKAMISFSNYLSFAITFVLSFGLVFEMPILMTIIVKLGLVSTKTLAKNKKLAILIIFVLAAILTPPDVISQTLLALPMILLFEIGMFFSKKVEGKKSSN